MAARKYDAALIVIIASLDFCGILIIITYEKESVMAVSNFRGLQ